MSRPSSDVAFSPSVKSVQARRGSRASYARIEARGGFDRATPEQAVLVTVEAWDVNCPQHIPRKLDAAAVEDELARLRERIAALEAENARLRDAPRS